MQSKIPVTVLTGFLGSGKTTLLNRILSENHGQRIAVIENEFGEIGVDHALVIDADEEVFEMNNGCICCTVRGDLIRILGSLLKRRDRFDRVLLETTGLANPGPVAQTFFVDDDVREHYALDGIVTLVDARHLPLHLDESEEAREQVAFADVIVLNKQDLVSEPELDKLERRVRGMNGMARIQRAVMASVPMAQVLDVGGFDLTRALEYKPTFLEPEYPFEWAGVYNCVAGEHVLELQPGPDPRMSLVLMPFEADSLVEAAERVFPIFSTDPARRAPGQHLSCGPEHQQVTLTGGTTMRFPISIAKPGRYALFAQHLPEEFELRWIGAPLVDQHTFAPAHTHDEAVTSVALTLREPLHRERFETWLGRLLQLQGTDLFRLKGFLHFSESPRRTVIQGVHMLVDTHTDDGWGNSPPLTQLVLIGRNLDRDELDAELRACVA